MIKVDKSISSKSDLYKLPEVKKFLTEYGLNFDMADNFSVHKKSGKLYRVTGVAINCTNNCDGRLMVQYTTLNICFVRELTEFTDKFKAMKINITNVVRDFESGGKFLIKKSDLDSDMKVIRDYYKSNKDNTEYETPDNLKDLIDQDNFDSVLFAQRYFSQLISEPELKFTDLGNGLIRFYVEK